MMFDQKSLDVLYSSVKATMSEKRFAHTAAVADMAVRLGELYAPERIDILRAAALLHDITKEYTTEEHLAICRRFGINLSKQDMLTPKTFHAKTAAAIIPEKYPEFAHPEVISAVRWHTTGRADMTLSEMLVYLADYIDDTRTFPDCVALRRLFWEAEPQTMARGPRLQHLYSVLLRSFDMTITALIDEGAPVADDTFSARNRLITEARD